MQRGFYGKETDTSGEMSGAVLHKKVVADNAQSATAVERGTGIEPAYAAWEAAVLPMN